MEWVGFIVQQSSVTGGGGVAVAAAGIHSCRLCLLAAETIEPAERSIVHTVVRAGAY